MILYRICFDSYLQWNKKLFFLLLIFCSLELINLDIYFTALLIYGVLDVLLLRWLQENLLGASNIRRYQLKTTFSYLKFLLILSLYLVWVKFSELCMMLLHALQTNNSYLFQVAALFHIGTTKSHPPIPEHLTAEAKDFLLKCLQKYIHDFVVSWFPSFPHYFFGWKEPITYTHTHTHAHMHACIYITIKNAMHSSLMGHKDLWKIPDACHAYGVKLGVLMSKIPKNKAWSLVASVHTHTHSVYLDFLLFTLFRL